MSAKQVLLIGGLALAILGMSYGLWYAAFAEHQALDEIGQSLSLSFQAAAGKDFAAAENSLLQYREAKYRYDRQVDVHGHWLGLSMLLIVLAIGYDHISYSQKLKTLLAWILLIGSAFFPLGVLMQTWSHGPAPRYVAALASAMVIIALAAMVIGFLRRQTA
jgi:hypothetical protein